MFLIKGALCYHGTTVTVTASVPDTITVAVHKRRHNAHVTKMKESKDLLNQLELLKMLL